jgi:hypothetical protein
MLNDFLKLGTKGSLLLVLGQASYVMYGSTKSIMNMSQLDQAELWQSVIEGTLDDLLGEVFYSIRLRSRFVLQIKLKLS